MWFLTLLKLYYLIRLFFSVCGLVKCASPIQLIWLWGLCNFFDLSSSVTFNYETRVSIWFYFKSWQNDCLGGSMGTVETRGIRNLRVFGLESVWEDVPIREGIKRLRNQEEEKLVKNVVYHNFDWREDCFASKIF